MLKDGDISKQAKINPAKLKPADEAQLLVAQPDGKFKAISINGDATLSSDGTLTVAGSGQDPEVERNPALDEPELAEGQIAVGGATRSERVNLGTGASAIPQRDSSGNLKAETADNADKLDNQNGTYYTDVSNHTAGSSANTSTPSGLGSGQTGVVGTTQTVPMQMITATNTGASSGTTDYIVEHNFNSIPVAVQVLEDDGSGNLEEVETEVVSTTSQTAIKFSVADKSFTAKIIGVKS